MCLKPTATSRAIHPHLLLHLNEYFAASPRGLTESIARAGVLYATCDARRTVHGGYKLLLSYRHSLTSGWYTLTLDTRNGHR